MTNDIHELVRKLRRAATAVYICQPEAVASAQSSLYTEAANTIEELIAWNRELATPIAKRLISDGLAKTRREHIESKDCWCNPTLDYVAENGNKVWVHHEPN